MSEETVSFTKEGVKLSYGRFLSDSAGGYVLLIIAAHLIAYSNVPVPPALQGDASQAKSAAIVLAGVFILLLGPPFGLALNSASWFSLGWIQVVFVNGWANYLVLNRVMNIMAFHTGQEYNIELLQKTFTFIDPAVRKKTRPRHSLYSQLHLIKKLMQSHYPHLMSRVEYLTGARIFTRNLSLLSLVMAFWPGLQGARTELLIAAAALTLLACLLDLYDTMELLFSAHAVCLACDKTVYELLAGYAEPKPEPGSAPQPESTRMNFAKCIRTLLDHAPKRAGQPSAAPESAG